MGLAVLSLGAVAVFSIGREPQGASEAPAQSVRRAPGKPDPLIADSAALMPASTQGLFLLMDREALLKLQPTARPSPKLREEGLTFLEATEGPGAHLFFGFDNATGRLRRVQRATRLPGVGGVSKAISRLVDRHGPARGAWDCPQRGKNPPMRRFAWSRGDAVLTLNVLLVGERASATTYVSHAEDARASLQEGLCTLVPPERMSKFPVAGRPPGVARRAPDP